MIWVLTFLFLILSLAGQFELWDWNTRGTPVGNPYIAVRYESFMTSNSYDAAKDKEFIEETFLGMLNGWAIHLRTSELDVYIDYPEKSNENELFEEIKKLTQNLKPRKKKILLLLPALMTS